MPRRKTNKLTRVHLWLDTDDVTYIRDAFRNTIGMSEAFRQIIHEAVRQLKEDRQ